MITRERCYSVYKHTFPNDKIYIGITGKNPIYRWNNGNGYKNTSPFMYNAIRKFGWENIRHEILFENLTQKEAENKEIELIAFYKSCDKNFGYNLKSGGNCGKHCQLTKEKISKHCKGKILSQETKNKISKSRKQLYRYGMPNQWKPIVQLDKQLNKIKDYSSMTEASISLNIKLPNISACCNGKRKTAGGYIWQYQSKDTFIRRAEEVINNE